MTISPIAEFMLRGGQKVPGNYDPDVYQDEVDGFLDRVQSEVFETEAAITDLDDAEAVDGFLDTAYAAITGAIRIAGAAKAQLAWDAIVDANLAKVDGRHGPITVDSETGKILKPTGWTAPDIEGILND